MGVDFDRNLNVCMAQPVRWLDWRADSLRFIRTIPKRGYLFFFSQSGTSRARRKYGARRFGWAAVLVFVMVALASIVSA